jgi:hypothetical protein
MWMICRRTRAHALKFPNADMNLLNTDVIAEMGRAVGRHGKSVRILPLISADAAASPLGPQPVSTDIESFNLLTQHYPCVEGEAGVGNGAR